MAAFPPVYPYPKFLTAAGDRLKPGMTLRGGGPGHRYAELRIGELWRVTSPLGYPSVLYLVSITQPHYFVRLNQPGERSWPPAAPGFTPGQELARSLAIIPLSFYFSYERFPEWYRKFEALNCVLYAVDKLQDGYVILFARSYDLPTDKNLLTITVSYSWLNSTWQWVGEQVELETLYNTMRDELSNWEVEKLRKFRQATRGWEQEFLNQPVDLPPKYSW